MVCMYVLFDNVYFGMKFLQYMIQPVFITVCNTDTTPCSTSICTYTRSLKSQESWKT
jgi:uncharacterized membrane protein YesL